MKTDGSKFPKNAPHWMHAQIHKQVPLITKLRLEMLHKKIRIDLDGKLPRLSHDDIYTK